MKQVFILCLTASAFWFVMFSPWTRDGVDFWGLMMVSTGVLAGAFLLYVIFWGAGLFFGSLFDFAGEQVGQIYRGRSEAGLLKIGLMLLLWIGPAEEIFWRGFVQRRLAGRFGGRWGYIWAVAIYSFVHVWGFNFMLLGAAMVGGIVWGAMFYRFKSIWPGIICHAVWDVAIFVVWPIQ